MIYDIVYAEHLVYLKQKVNEMLQAGWVLAGGIAINARNDRFYQALSKTVVFK